MYVPMTDRACYFGDGIYEVTYCYNHRIFALEEHVERLIVSAKALDINCDFDEEELMRLIKRMTDKVDGDKLSIYFQLSRGTGIRAHEYREDMKSNLFMMIKETELRDMTKPIAVGLSEDKRHGYCGHKTLNLFANVMAFQKAMKAGYSEVILQKDNVVTECAHSNVSILKEGTVYTPYADGRIFDGIGRKHLLKACERLNVPWKYAYFDIDALYDADEIIVTASGSLCIDVNSIEGKKVCGKAQALLYEIRKNVVEEFNQETGSHIFVER